MKKYKVLMEDLKSPFRGFQVELGKEYVCDNFDESDKECSNGFYATDLEGLMYSLNADWGNKVFEVEVGGRQKIFNQYKQRFDKQTIIREISKEELEPLLEKEGEKLGYDLYHACYPVNPFDIEPSKIGEDEIQLLSEWSKVEGFASSYFRDSPKHSVWAFVGHSVWNSVGDSIVDSVWYSVGDSVGDSVWAYIGSLFPNIEDWGVDHAKGECPFQPAVDLWHKGLIPSSNGNTWRLHGGKNAEVLFEIEESELKKRK